MNILVTAIGSFSADCVINTLKSKGHYVVGIDIYPSEWLAVSKDCDVVYRSPLANDSVRYIQFLLDTIKSENIKFIIPLTDVEIDVLNENRKLFLDKGVILCMPSTETLMIARNKYNLYKRFADDDNVPSIRTILSMQEEIDESIIPAIAKPLNGRSSEGLIRVDNLEELRSVNIKSGYLIQESLFGSVFTVDYVRNSNTGTDFAIAREELLRTKNGAGVTVKITKDCILSELVSYIGRNINVNGCVNMEFIHHEGNYYLIDINPRFSAGVAFSLFVGYDMVTNHLNCHSEKEICDAVDYDSQIITKRYKEELIKRL